MRAHLRGRNGEAGAAGGMERGAAACALLLALAACLGPASGQGKRPPGGALLGEPSFPGGGRRAEGREAGWSGLTGVSGRQDGTAAPPWGAQVAQ